MKSITHYQLILDMSGSMGSARFDTLNAVNAQIESIRKSALEHPKQEIQTSLCVFNTSVKTIFNSLSPQQLPLLTMNQYTPNGNTALLDALGMRIVDLERSIGSSDDVVLVIITDGEENASQSFNYPQVAETIARLKQTERWTFSFLGADIDAWQMARNLNIEKEEVVSFNKSEIRDTFNTVNESLSEYLTNKESGLKNKGLFKK